MSTAEPAPSADPVATPGEERRSADVVVIGGGVAGLVAGLECARLGLGVVVLEHAERPGGCVGRIDLDGLALDSGAESFATRNGSVAELLGRLGLEDRIVPPNRGGAWLVWGDRGERRAAPLPRTGVLGIPANPLGDDVRAIIGWRGAWRAWRDRITPILKIGRAERLGPLVRQRMGAAVLDRLVTPISAGVYSTDPDDLDVDVVAPGLNEAMTRAGSLSGGVGQLVEARRAGSAVLGLRGGMHTLVDALVAELERFGADVRTGVRVTGLEALPARPSDAGAVASSWRAIGESSVETTDVAGAASAAPATSVVTETAARKDSALDAGRVVVDARFAIVATPAHVSRGLLAGVAPDGALEQAWPDAASVELVTLVLDAPELDAAPRGTGVLVAADAPDVTAKALTHSTAKWSWLAEAAGGRQVVRLSYGRASATNPLTGLADDAVTELAVRDASALLGVALDRSQVRAAGRSAWRDALSQAAVGQPARVRALEASLEDRSGLALTGSWVAGTGLASVVPHAIEAAGRIRHLALRIAEPADDAGDA
ncbi:oxygen-dependent protoporphyrinogen oxidase [Agromyces flavus]|uniref:Oxygen-dependent protoporphyrinogen oxidase n=1 Tax=Agromyces flavus TaxID=589382 RepID=A0A1H1YJY7_9MICO|nr:FAD-dependent oxidoreductase [Agromyces flavus]MCP2366714.1 oxygen-dependent protoporphyrinogen oxidase [Agromyces flavus]GGI45228.1 protoporphyrinogen oxidase [Agromyces flavus]SDT21589.1 oxygen-dependent protoporphyrinogen oxidase [Agromyces flavus]